MSTAVGVTCRGAWDAFLETSHAEVGFKQSTWWAEFLSEHGCDYFGVVLRDEQEIVAGATVLKRRFAKGRCFYYLPQGPMLPKDAADAEAAWETILEYIARQRQFETRTVSHLRVEPNWLARPDFVGGCREVSNWLEPRDTLCVDISQPEEAILAQMRPKGRYNIRAAQRSGVSIVEDTSPAGMVDFMTIYREALLRRERTPYSRRYIRDLVERLVALDCGTLLFAEYQGVRLAAAIVIYFGDTASYEYGGAKELHGEVMAPYLMHFEAMRIAKARGLRWYDFREIPKADDPDRRWAKFNMFKHHFGGCERNFVPALDFVFNEKAYRDYREQE